MLKIDIFNETLGKIDSKAIKSTVITAFGKLFPALPSEVEIIFTTEKKIAELNQQHLKRKGPTDIISFPNANPDKSIVSLGSLVICLSQVKKYQENLDEVIIHGMVHLAGYDHEKDPAGWDKAINKLNNAE